MFLRKTKIIATVGPSSASKSVLKAMVQAGVDVFRINFSHGKEDFYHTTIKNIKEIAQKNAALLQNG